MKRVLLVLTLLPFFGFQCEKDPVNKCFKGKVIRITCASYVIQFLDTDSLGDDQWKDSMAGDAKTYDNVFDVSNKCHIQKSFKEGDTLYFRMEKPVKSDCVSCAMYDAPPMTQLYIKNVSSTPCE